MLFRNKKTGKMYDMLYKAIDCTNARDGTRVVVYRKHEDYSGVVFVRELEEFYEKFEIVN